MDKQFWLVELNQHGNPALEDGPHPEREGAERALTLRRRLGMIDAAGKSYSIAEVILTEPTGKHDALNEEALKALGA